MHSTVSSYFHQYWLLKKEASVILVKNFLQLCLVQQENHQLSAVKDKKICIKIEPHEGQSQDRTETWKYKK